MADQHGEVAHSVDQVLDSTLGSVDQAEDAVLRVAADMGFDEDDQHRIGISVRECAVNAVVHGNRYNTGKKVHLRIHRLRSPTLASANGSVRERAGRS